MGVDLVWRGSWGRAEDMDLIAGQGDWGFKLAVMVRVQPILWGLGHVCPICKLFDPTSKVLFSWMSELLLDKLPLLPLSCLSWAPSPCVSVLSVFLCLCFPLSLPPTCSRFCLSSSLSWSPSLHLPLLSLLQVFLCAFLPGRAGLTSCSTLLDLPSPAGFALLSLGLTAFKHGVYVSLLPFSSLASSVPRPPTLLEPFTPEAPTWELMTALSSPSVTSRTHLTQLQPANLVFPPSSFPKSSLCLPLLLDVEFQALFLRARGTVPA